MAEATTIAEKPYNKCLECQHRKEGRCDGPRTSAMPLLRWCEFMRDLKKANRLTNQEIADRSKVSVKTIERIMALNCDKDIYRETCRLIEHAIIGSSNQYPCYLAFEETVPQENEQLARAMLEMERLVGDNEEYKAALADIHDSYKAEMQLIRDDAQNKIDFLRGQINFLRETVESLLEENRRKSAIIDRFVGKIDV